jgi:glycosyltransferase involved in cell wall biosynthesis
MDRYVGILGFPRTRVTFIPRPADHRFWRPLDKRPGTVVASVVGEYGDVAGLLSAVGGLDVPVVVAGSAPGGVEGPPNVRFQRFSPQGLRDLYAQSRFVVAPLNGNRGGQGGSRAIYEAMARGKAVVATRTNGLSALGLVREGEIGLFVEPGDVEGLRRAIERLWGHPEEAEAMGRRAREIVEEGLNLDRYLEQVAEVLNASNLQGCGSRRPASRYDERPRKGGS